MPWVFYAQARRYDAWNEMGIGGVDGRYNGQEIQKSNINVVVVVNTHGYYNQIGYGLNEQSTTIEEIKNKLKEKSVKGVVLGGCNQGHVSHVSDNIASFFLKFQMVLMSLLVMVLYKLLWMIKEK